jgi:hypothetical protein
MKDYYDFKPPGSIKEAQGRKRKLEIDIANIDLQLADRNRTLPDGRRMSGSEHNEWMRRARSSAIIKRAEHSYLKDWIKDLRRERTARAVLGHVPKDANDMLRLVRDRLLDPGVSRENLADLIDDYLRQVL